MTLRWEGDSAFGTWIFFERIKNSPTGKTMIFKVASIDDHGIEGDKIGEVKWFGPWRQYAFFPDHNTVYEKTCLSEIAQFCRELMDQRKARRKKAKPEGSNPSKEGA